MGTPPAMLSPGVDAEVARTLGLDPTGQRRRRRGRVLLAGLVALLVLGVAALLLLRNGAPVGPALETRAATRGELVVKVTATGTLEPVTAVDIAPEISGRVRKVHVDWNDPVEQGQVLIELDTDLLAAQAEQAAAQVALAGATAVQARATRAESQLNLERAQALVAREVGARADVDTARAAHDRAVGAVAAAEAQERAARAALRVARTNLEKATIRSPIKGLVLSRSVDEGQTVVAAFQPPTVLRLAEDLRRMKLVVDVDEADVGHVSAGQAASFTVAAYPARTFDARVVSVRNSPRELEKVVTYGAVLEVDNKDGLLRPGMTGTAQIAAETVKDALLVPNAALRWRPLDAPLTPGGANVDTTTRVYVVEGGRPVAVPLKAGVTDGTLTAVRETDLKEGAAIVVGGKGQAR